MHNDILIRLAKSAELNQLKQALQCPLFLVGGSVRDAILGKDTADLDLTCPLSPEQMLSQLEKANLRTIPTGLKHQTVTAVINNKNIEITSFRTSGMLPDGGLKLGNSIEEDLSYRDFTINAIAFDLEQLTLVDPYNGSQDLKNKLLKAVIDPATRFKEDPLRIMRLLRFHSQLDFIIDSITYEAAKNLARQVNQCSIERIREEFNKLITGLKPASAISMMQELGIMEKFIPEFSICHGFEQNKFHHKDVFYHTLDVIESTRADLTLRLSAFFHDIGKPPSLSTDELGDRHFYKHERIGGELTKEIMSRLKYSNKMIEDVCCLVDTHMRPLDAGKPGLRRLLRDTGELYSLWRELKLADAGSVRKDLVNLHSELEKFDQDIADIKSAPDVSPLANLALKGSDLIEMGYKPGPIFGTVLRALHEKVLDQPELNQKNLLANLAKELIIKLS